jgi:hydroxymethylpyrimidine pyrophosphatase-like HAD family hydrolase
LPAIPSAPDGLHAVVTDLDGTLLRSDGTVSDYTCTVLNRLLDRGIRLIFATARPKESALRVALPIAPAAPVIYSNGAAIYDPLKGRTLRTQTIPTQIVRDIVHYVRESFPQAQIAVDSAIPPGLGSSRTLDPEWPAGWGATPGDRALWRMDSGLPPPRAVTCLMVLGSWGTHLDVPPRWPVTVTSSGQGLIEFSARSASKIAALRWLCRHLGIAMESLVAFGDMPTDAEMLEGSGLGVAVANAHKGAISVARRVTGSNDEDGVAHFLEELFRMS